MLLLEVMLQNLSTFQVCLSYGNLTELFQWKKTL